MFWKIEEKIITTRRERLKSALYLRFKKRKTFFWKKLEISEKKILSENVRMVPKKVKGTPLDILTYIL